MNSNFIYPFETVQQSNIFLSPLINIQHPDKTFLYISNNDIVLSDYFVAIYGNKTNVNDAIAFAQEGFVCKTKLQNTIVYIYQKEKLSNEFKATLNCLIQEENGIIYSRYSKINDNTKKKLLKYYKSFSNDDRTNFNILNMLNRYLFPNNHLSMLAEMLSYNEMDKNLLYEIKKIGEYGSAISIDNETLKLDNENFSRIVDEISNSLEVKI